MISRLTHKNKALIVFLGNKNSNKPVKMTEICGVKSYAPVLAYGEDIFVTFEEVRPQFLSFMNIVNLTDTIFSMRINTKDKQRCFLD